MKTIIATTCYLDEKDYLLKTIKFCKYYNDIKHYMDLGIDNILLFDNHSSVRNIGLLQANIKSKDSPYVKRFDKHLTRTSHLEYPYLYRAVYHFQYLFNQGYEKIVYMDNDLYLLSYTAMEWVKNAKGWASPYCNLHNFPETGIQVITKDCQAYWDMVKGLTEEEFINKYNGKCMETTLPLTDVNKGLIGDRYTEMNPTPQQDEKMDYWAQASVTDQFVFGMKC